MRKALVSKHDYVPKLSYKLHLNADMAYTMLDLYGGSPNSKLLLEFNGKTSADMFFNHMVNEEKPRYMTISDERLKDFIDTEEKRNRISEKARKKLLTSFSEPVQNFFIFTTMIKSLDSVAIKPLIKDKSGLYHYWLTNEQKVLQYLYLVNEIGRLSDKALKSSKEINDGIRAVGLYGSEVDFRSSVYRNITMKLKFIGERVWQSNEN